MGLPQRIPDSSDQSPTPEPTHVPSSQPPCDLLHGFSIVVGGPFYEALQRYGIVRYNLPNIARRIVALVMLIWLPLLLLSLKDGVAWGHQVRIPFLYDFSMYGRLLVALPLLLLAELVIDPAIRLGVGEFVDGGFVPQSELPEYDRILRRIQRLRDSWIPEATMLILAFFPYFLFQREWTSHGVSTWHTSAHGLTTAGWWFALISAPPLHFIIYRWMFRYLLWAILLWRVGRLHLTLVPTHPDRAAGLNFLGLVQKRFGILFCAFGCAFAGRVGNEMLYEGAPLSSFRFVMAGFIVLSVIVGLLPLALLAPRLREVRKQGLIEYGRLANSYSFSFDRKWVHYLQSPSEPLLGTGDIQSLADMGNSFKMVDDMNIAPITQRLVLQLAVQAAAPIIPIIIFGTPAPELVKAVMRMVA